jgi:hypothetical protein
MPKYIIMFTYNVILGRVRRLKLGQGPAGARRKSEHYSAIYNETETAEIAAGGFSNKRRDDPRGNQIGTSRDAASTLGRPSLRQIQ